MMAAKKESPITIADACFRNPDDTEPEDERPENDKTKRKLKNLDSWAEYHSAAENDRAGRINALYASLSSNSTNDEKFFDAAQLNARQIHDAVQKSLADTSVALPSTYRMLSFDMSPFERFQSHEGHADEPNVSYSRTRSLPYELSAYKRRNSEKAVLKAQSLKVVMGQKSKASASTESSSNETTAITQTVTKTSTITTSGL